MVEHRRRRRRHAEPSSALGQIGATMSEAHAATIQDEAADEVEAVKAEALTLVATLRSNLDRLEETVRGIKAPEPTPRSSTHDDRGPDVPPA